MEIKTFNLENSEKTLFYIHIPKTAGTSFTSFLKVAFGEKFCHVGLKHDEKPESLHKYNLGFLRDFPVAGGHFDFSICRRDPFLIPITILRNPTDRLVSLYHYIKHSDHLSNAYFRKRIEQNNWSLLDFVCDSQVIRNFGVGQIRQIAGYLWADDPGKLQVGDLLSIAKHNLNRFTFIGTTESFSESIKLFCHVAGISEIKKIPYENKGVGKEPIAPEVIASIQELTQPEHELYNYARQLFDQQYEKAFNLTNSPQSSSVQIETINLQSWNADKFHIEIEDHVLDIPAMLTPPERHYIHWHMKNIFTGSGEAVELGSFLGGSTAATLSGLVKNTNKKASQRILKVYDLFEWTLADLNVYKSVFDINADIKVGESFQPLFYKHIHPWTSQVKIFPGDIHNHTWSGEDIEYLFVDLMKSPSIATHVVKEFFPHFIPGVSWVIHQDYKYFYTFWIHLIMYRLRDYLIPAYSVKNTSTVAFRCIKQVPINVCETACDLESFTVREINTVFQHSKSLLKEDQDYWHYQVTGANIWAYIYFIKEQFSVSEIDQVGINVVNFNNRVNEVFPRSSSDK